MISKQLPRHFLIPIDEKTEQSIQYLIKETIDKATNKEEKYSLNGKQIFLAPNNESDIEKRIQKAIKKLKTLKTFKGSNYHVLSDAKGEIGKILMVYRNNDFLETEYNNFNYSHVYIDVLTKFYQIHDDKIDIITAAYEKNSEKVKDLNKAINILTPLTKLDQKRSFHKILFQFNDYVLAKNTISDITPDNSFWVQDEYLIIKTMIGSVEKTLLIEPFDTSFNKSLGITKKLVDNNPKYLAVRSPLAFRAGNFIIGEDFVLIGIDEVFFRNQGLLKNGENDCRCLFYNERCEDEENCFGTTLRTFYRKLFGFGATETKKIYFIRSSPEACAMYPKPADLSTDYDTQIHGEQHSWDEKFYDWISIYADESDEARFQTIKQPIYHLDMFITYAGQTVYGRNILVIGDPISGEPFHHPQTKIMKFLIDEIVDQLKEDFVIIRNPLPITYLDKFLGYNGEKKEWKRKWYLAAYNNCVVQIPNKIPKENNHSVNGKPIDNMPKPNKKVVFLPRFGSDFSAEKSETLDEAGDWSELKKYDLANQMLWEKLGFKVLLMTDYNHMAVNRGALKCMIKCLERY
ncbi:MAG: hypothetical protein AAF502_18050 [Bacteroidota bacterium]